MTTLGSVAGDGAMPALDAVLRTLPAVLGVGIQQGSDMTNATSSSSAYPPEFGAKAVRVLRVTSKT